MRRSILTAAAVVAVTGFAPDAESGVKRHYSHAYYGAADRCGAKDAVGRNVRREHSTLASGRHVSKARYRVLTARLDAMCRPVATPVTPEATAPTTQQAAPTGSSGSCPQVIPGYIIQRESGGDPNAVNPSSHAFGCYQLMPEHYAPGGDCADLDRSVQGQAACAQRLPASAWDETR